jgi:hypothetical protein
MQVSGIDTVWARIEAELKARRRSKASLAEQLGETAQAVGNWKRRGVPRGQYPAIAAALGKSIDWVAGNEADIESPIGLSQMALRLAHEFDKIKNDKAQLGAFAQIIGIVAVAACVPPEPPIK